MFALLIDPEKASDEWLRQIMSIVNFCNKREQSSSLELPSVAKIMSKANNFCNKREQNQTCLSYAERGKNHKQSE